MPANSGQITGLFKDGMPADVHPVWPSFEPNVGQAQRRGHRRCPLYLDPNAGRPARLLQWNIGLQREINRNLVVEASYRRQPGRLVDGQRLSRGTSSTTNNLAPLNVISQDTLRAYGFNDFTSSTESHLLTTTVSNLTPAQRDTLAARGITGVPYANFPTNQSVRQSLLPFPQYSNSHRVLRTVAGSPLGNTWYDSFQLNVTQRFSHGLSLQHELQLLQEPGADQLGRPVQQVARQDLYRRIDLPHQFRLTAQYQVPRLRASGNAVVSNKHRLRHPVGLGRRCVSELPERCGCWARPSSNGTNPISHFLGYWPGRRAIEEERRRELHEPLVGGLDGQQRKAPYRPARHQLPLLRSDQDHCPESERVGEYSQRPVRSATAGQPRFFRGIRAPPENVNFSRNFRITERVQLNVRVEFNNVFNRLQSCRTPRTARKLR